MIPKNTKREFSFWGNVEYPSNKAANLARNAFAKHLKRQGNVVKLSSLPGQLRPYSGLGQPDGRSGTVYYVTVVWEPTDESLPGLTVLR